MRLSFGLEARQVQVQKMSPRMIQSMELLQLPILELQERIEQELSENPVLELQEQDPNLPEEQTEEESSDTPTSDEKELVVDPKSDNADDFERLLNLDQEVPEYFDERPRASQTRIDEEGDRKHDAMSNVADRPESLNDYLLHQLGEMELEPQLAVMAERIISSLDARDGGYLRCSLTDLLPQGHTPADLELAERALAIVQNLDPAGIAARDLRECLLLQLDPEMYMYDEMKVLIEKHLADLRDNRLPAIQRATGISIDEIEEAWGELRKLNPKPGARFSDNVAPSITPEISIERSSDGRYQVIMEEGRLPTLRISEYYRQRLINGDATPEEREFIKRKIGAAQWLIESIEQRRNTLRKVTEAVIKYQLKFLEEGPEFIEPLKMQQIADQVGVHVTTVSRAVDDKWIQTPRGILPLRKFFVGGTTTDDGEDIAWDTIRIKLQETIDKENKHEPLSDEELVKELKKQGLNVARRTITKYREKMGIPTSRQRRKY